MRNTLRVVSRYLNALFIMPLCGINQDFGLGLVAGNARVSNLRSDRSIPAVISFIMPFP
jgi:hypothetical protein